MPVSGGYQKSDCATHQDIRFYIIKKNLTIHQNRCIINCERLKDQVKLFDWIERLEAEGAGAKRPLVDYLGDEIYELRIKLSDKETRILYFFIFGKAIILANAWNKKGKAQKRTEYNKQIEKARKCRIDYLERFRNIKELP